MTDAAAQALRRVRVYARAVLADRRAGQGVSWRDAFAGFVPWWRSFQSHEDLSEADLPWLTFPAVGFLKRSLRPTWRIFEYGSGASTIYFARRCREVLSIEHDAVWATKVRAALDRFGISNCTLRHVEPQDVLPETDDGRYRSEAHGWERYRFERYVQSIDDERDASFDVVLIDGRARRDCVRHAIGKVRPGGLLILDNTDRPRYGAALGEVPRTWRRRDFPGPCAGADFFTRTTIWTAPAAHDGSV